MFWVWKGGSFEALPPPYGPAFTFSKISHKKMQITSIRIMKDKF